MNTYGFTVNCEGNVAAQMNRMAAAMEKMNATASTTTAQVSEKYAVMGSKIRGVFDGLKNLILPSLGFATLFGGFEFFTKAVEHTNALNKAVTDLHQTYLTMHGSMNLSEGQLKEQAEAMDKTTIYSKPTIISAQAMLATFREVKGKIFTSTMDSVSDYAAKFMGGDMVSAAKSLGIALNSPLIGMTRLRRQGISFTEEQKATIKNLVAQGHLMEAQQMILKEVKSETGGQAQAFAGTDEGKQMIAKKAWDGAYERVGGIINKVKNELIPYIAKLANGVIVVVNWFSKNRDIIIGLIKLAAGMAAGYLAYKVVVEGITIATEAWKAAQIALDAALEANPISLIVGGLAVITGAFFSMKKEIDETYDANERLSNSLQKYRTDQKKIDQDIIYAAADKYKDAYKGLDKKGHHILFSKKEKDKLIEDEISAQFAKVKGTFVDPKNVQGVQAKLKAVNDLGVVNVDFMNYKSILKKRDSDGGTGTGTNNVKDDAINSQKLAGAAGGLGSAKVINLKIDTVMKVENHDNNNLAKHAETGAQYILRTLRNIGDGETATQ